MADNIKLTQGPLKITYEVTLDLNGKVLEQSGADSVFVIGSEKTKERGKLTVVDSDTTREHKFKPNADHLWGLDETGGTKTVHGGIIYGGRASSGGGVNVENGTLIMEGGSIVGCRALNGQTGSGSGGVYLERDGKFTLEKGSIVGCRAGTYGGVYIKRGKMAMTGGEIAGCTAGQDPSTGLAGQDLSAGLYLGGGRLSANGGTVKDEVFCVGTIDSAVGKSGCTEFQARVTNQKIATGGGWLDGLIRHGNFRGTVLNQNGGGIDGGTFLGDVENIDAHLGAGITGSGGTFYGKVTNGSKDGPAKSARIRGGTFRGEVINEKSGMISIGTFYEGIVDEGGEVRGHTVTYKIGETVYAQHAAAKGSGFYAEGNIEYWQCRDCGKYFADAKAAKEITRADTVIPAMGRPDRGEPVKAPGTGGAGIALYGVMALLSLTGCAWLRRKKK